MTQQAIRVGGRARLTNRTTGVAKGNHYPVLAIVGNKATLGHPTRDDKRFLLRDLS